MARTGEFGDPVVLDVEGFDVRISNPLRPYFSARGETKLDLAEYYLSVGPGIVRGQHPLPEALVDQQTGRLGHRQVGMRGDGE